MIGGNRIAMIIAVWTVSAILGLTVAVLAVGWLGLWVAVGAIGAFGTTIVCGVIGQFLFAADFDAMIEARRADAEDGDSRD
jgi:fatty acid desaturase